MYLVPRSDAPRFREDGPAGTQTVTAFVTREPMTCHFERPSNKGLFLHPQKMRSSPGQPRTVLATLSVGAPNLFWHTTEQYVAATRQLRPAAKRLARVNHVRRV